MKAGWTGQTAKPIANTGFRARPTRPTSDFAYRSYPRVPYPPLPTYLFILF